MLNLFDLIKSMSKSEKRYFKLHAASFSGDNPLYLQLFDIIDKQKKYNEEQISKAIKSNNFSVAKKYLYDAILKSLRAFHSDKHKGFQLLNAIQNISLLRNKGMIKDALKLYEKVKGQMADIHLYSLLFELLDTGEAIYAAYLPQKDLNDQLDEIYREKKKCLEYLNNITEYKNINRKIRTEWRRLYPIRCIEQEKEIKELLNHPLLLGAHKALTSVTKSTYYECITTCHAILLNHEAVRDNSKEALVMLKNQSENSIVYYSKLLVNYNNLLQALAKLKDESEFKYYFQEFEVLHKKLKGKFTTHFDVFLDRMHLLCNLYYLIEQERFEEITNLEEYIEVFKEKNEKFLDVDFNITVGFLLAVAFFHQGDYEKTLIHLEPVMDEEKNKPKVAYVCSGRILNMMAHYEMDNFLLLNSLVRSTQRYLNKNERLFESEKILIHFFKWLSTNYNANNIEEKFESLCRSLTALNDNKYEFYFFDHLKLQHWIKKNKNLPLTQSIL